MLTLLLASAAVQSTSIVQAEREIRIQRAAFNRALAAGNVRGIAPILADDAQLVTGADSMIVAGKAAQLALWNEDLAGPKRRFYVRTPTRIRVSLVGPMALETGQWRELSAKRNWASGDYVARVRLDGPSRSKKSKASPASNSFPASGRNGSA